MNLLLSPYCVAEFYNANDLGYITMMFASYAPYLERMLVLFLIFDVVVGVMQHKKRFWTIGISCLLFAISAFSSGFYMILTVLIPLSIFDILIHIFRWGDRKVVFYTALLYVAAAAGLVSNKLLVGYASRDFSIALIPAADFWDNCISMFSGYLNLCYALPWKEGIVALSVSGIGYLSNFVLVIALLGMGILSAIKLFQQFGQEKNVEGTDRQIISLLANSILWTNLAAFMVLDLTYGGGIYESRYLIPCHLMLIVVFVCTMSDINWKSEKRNYIYNLGCFVLSLCVCISVMMSYYQYIETRNDKDYYVSLANGISRTEGDVVFFMGEGLILDGVNVRCLDLGREYKCINTEGKMVQNGGTYKYEEYEGELIKCVFLVPTSEGEVETRLSDEQWNYEETIGGYSIYTKWCQKILFRDGFLSYLG